MQERRRGEEGTWGKTVENRTEMRGWQGQQKRGGWGGTSLTAAVWRVEKTGLGDQDRKTKNRKERERKLLLLFSDQRNSCFSHTVWPLKMCVFMRVWRWTMLGTLFNQVCVNMRVLSVCGAPLHPYSPPRLHLFGCPALRPLSWVFIATPPPCSSGRLPSQRLKRHALVLLFVSTAV